MEEYKLLLKKYRKLQKKHVKISLQYSSFTRKGLCREDAMCGIDVDITKKIKLKLNKSDNYYNKKTFYIKRCIDMIKNKNKHLLDAISRSVY
jgi:hypothetical protein|tara:strand:- start:1097 stop:1372 length:276 start_codon:yes stop_codon:yes gene_type:complete